MNLVKFKSKFEKEINKKINFEKNFASNQIDSLDLISIIMIIEKDLKIKISEDKLSSINNFKELEKFIKKLK